MAQIQGSFQMCLIQAKRTYIQECCLLKLQCLPDVLPFPVKLVFTQVVRSL